MLNSSRRGLLAALLGGALVPGLARAQKGAAAPRTLAWDDLIPKGWDPTKQFRNRDIGAIREGSPKEQALMKELRLAWDNAPVRTDLEGARIRLPGYVVPLDALAGGKLTQFLLVPYFGACIHSPPPPANQIVLVKLGKPAALRSMEAIWVSGTLSTQRSESGMGVSSYALAGEKVEPYRSEKR